MSVNGGFGDDFFDVLRNRFLLDLNGDSDDDTFIVRSFLILDLDDEGNATNTSLGELQLLGSNGSDTFDFRGDFDNSTEEADELPDYVVNSLVDIDGGTGNDRLVVVGTEADDKYVVTDGQVFGGGLTISYTNIEALEVTGEAGDDTITILSTSPSLVTYVPSNRTSISTRPLAESLTFACTRFSSSYVTIVTFLVRWDLIHLS